MSAKVPVRKIILATSRVFGVRTSAIYGPAKPMPVARARQAAYLIANEQGWGVTHIGRVLARDHSTIAYGVANAREIERRDQLYRERCASIRQHIEEMGAQAV